LDLRGGRSGLSPLEQVGIPSWECAGHGPYMVPAEVLGGGSRKVEGKKKVEGGDRRGRVFC